MATNKAKRTGNDPKCIADSIDWITVIEAILSLAADKYGGDILKAMAKISPELAVKAPEIYKMIATYMRKSGKYLSIASRIMVTVAR